jgi:hypothetical protein
MPTVITYWQLPADDNDFITYLCRTEGAVMIPNKPVPDRAMLLPRSIIELRRCKEARVDLSVDRFVASLPVDAMLHKGTELFSIRLMEACTIGYRRPYFRDGKLARSNLAAYWEYPNSDATSLIPKDAEFVSWAKRVFAHVRRMTPEKLELNGYPYRATRRAKQAFDAGEIQIDL